MLSGRHRRPGVRDFEPISEEWRVEVDLGEEGHGPSLGERLRALDLDDEARERLGGRVIVTRDGPHVFLYAGSGAAAREAERVARGLVAEEQVSAEISVTRWDEAAGAWVGPQGQPGAEAAASSPAELSARVRAHQGEGEPEVEHPVFVFLGAHKPGIARDLGI